MTIRRRKQKSGNVTWQVDLGVVQGQRLQRSFKTQSEAAAFAQQAQDMTSRRGSVGVRTALVDLPARVRQLEVQNAGQAAALQVAQKEIADLKEQNSRLRAHVSSAEGIVALSEVADRIVSCPMPRCSGVYFLLLEGEVVYVGQALSIFRRLHDHLGLYEFDAVAWIPVAPRDLNRVERLWINKLGPRHNVRYLPVPPEVIA